MKLRRNEMKLRKYAISSPKNFPTPHWIIQDLHRGICDFLHRGADELTLYSGSVSDLKIKASLLDSNPSY